MDKSGEGEEVRLPDLQDAREMCFAGFTHEMFQEVRRSPVRSAEAGPLGAAAPGQQHPNARRRPWPQMCVLAGCDFAKALPGIGVKKAHAQMKRTRCFFRASAACQQAPGFAPAQRAGLPSSLLLGSQPGGVTGRGGCCPLQAVRALKFNGVQVPPDYLKKCQRALWVFKHQRVYCPERKVTVHLHEVQGGDLALGARVPEAAQVRGWWPCASWTCGQARLWLATHCRPPRALPARCAAAGGGRAGLSGARPAR